MAQTLMCKSGNHKDCSGKIVEGAPGVFAIGKCKCKCHKQKGN